MVLKRGEQRPRALKARIRQLLMQDSTDAVTEQILRLPPKPAINALFPFLQDGDHRIKWTAVRCFGALVSMLADEDLESARVVMRRLMWSLNDESGGIGWGAPEAMGEVLARHPKLASEYASILISYCREDGNYLEHERLQRGLLWGIARAVESRPFLFGDAVRHLMSYFSSPDGTVRGLAARVMGLLRAPEACSILHELSDDWSEISLDFRGQLGKHYVKELVQEALASIPCAEER
jgi:hypothetical protein